MQICMSFNSEMQFVVFILHNCYHFLNFTFIHYRCTKMWTEFVG